MKRNEVLENEKEDLEVRVKLMRGKKRLRKVNYIKIGYWN